MDRDPSTEPRSGTSVEDAVDALEDGDRPIRPGSARAALRHQVFRRVFVGAFLSNIGSWMQNVVLGAYVYELTDDPTFVGIVGFAQLGPLLLFSMVGGALADVFDRRRLLIVVSAIQGLLSLGLAVVVSADGLGVGAIKAWIVLIVFLIGMGQAVFGPTYSALLPGLVGKHDLAGAISLNSAQMNGSRVVGPIIGAAVGSAYGAAWVFNLNAASFLLVIAALASVRLPAPVIDHSGPQGLSRVWSGVRIARRSPVLRKCLFILVTYSLVSLTFITQMPTLADRNLGIDPESQEYGWLYACFGIGALAGALSIGTVLAGRDLTRIVRTSLFAFSGFLAVFALVRSPGPAYVLVLLVGLAYFAMITSLSTVFQQALDESSRGRVMALWIMGFGGTVPIGGLIAGAAIEATSVTTTMLIGAAWAFVLGLYADFRSERAGTPAPEPGLTPAD